MHRTRNPRPASKAFLKALSKDRQRPKASAGRKRAAVSSEPSAFVRLEAVAGKATDLARRAGSLVFEHGAGDWRPFVIELADLLGDLARACRAQR